MEKAQINLTDEEIDKLVEPLVDELAKAVEKKALEEVEKEMNAKKRPDLQKVTTWKKKR